MKKKLRILIIEDSEADAEILLRQIGRSGYEPISARVETKEAMQAALSSREWDIIIADYSLPRFGAEGALETLKESGLDLPFILVSGTVGEEKAVRMMKAGADDYLLKDHLERLCPAIEREIGEFLNRQERRKAEEELRRNRNQLAVLSEASGILGSSLDYTTTINRAIQAAIPKICDLCLVHLIKEGGAFRRLAAAHSDPRQAVNYGEWLDQQGYSKALRTGEVEIISEIRDSELLKIGIQSSLSVPLVARNRTLGSLTLMMAESGRRLGSSDLWVAQEFASRTASAIDNALLYDEAQRAINVRDEFLMIASHELKTPITSLKMQLQLTRRGIHPESGAVPPADQLFKTIDTSLTQVDRLTKLIEDMLDASRMQSGKLSFELGPVNLGEVIEEVLGRFSTELSSAKCQVVIETQPDIVGYWDKTRIEQVFINLISNAIKYAPGSSLSVIASRDADQAKVIVRDTGPGIAKEKQKNVFERFGRGTLDHNIVGLGLGLYICRQIVEAHGGTIGVYSSEGEGSAFVIELPLAVDESHVTRGISFNEKADLDR